MYESSRFAYESLGFIVDKTKPRQTDTEHGKYNSSQISVFVKMFNKFQGNEVFNPLTPNVNYSGRTAPLTSKVAFYIFIQQI